MLLPAMAPHGLLLGFLNGLECLLLMLLLGNAHVLSQCSDVAVHDKPVMFACVEHDPTHCLLNTLLFLRFLRQVLFRI